MYYITCKLCGAHLDPEERCDCEKIAAEAATPTAGEKNRQKTKINSILPNRNKNIKEEVL